MKKFFYLMSLCLCMFAGVAVMSSCGSDDDVEIDSGSIDNIKVGITENGNTMSLTTGVNGGYMDVITATFDSNDVCIKCVEKMTFSSKDIANQTWDALMAELDGEEKARYSKDGKTITIDMTEEFKGFSRADVRDAFEWMMSNLGV